MFEISVIEVDNQKENIVLKKSINLDQNLDCFLMISSSNRNLAENLLNNALENIIDKISKEETYNDFWIALENINFFLKKWRDDSTEDEEEELDVIISILNGNNLMFSNIWKSTVYLINRNSELIELTERNENKKSFLFISNWVLANSEIIISSTVNVLKYLSKSDILDWMILSNNIENFNRNIKNILQSEIVEKNCIISSLKYKNELLVEENEKFLAVKELAVKVLDTNISKKILTKCSKIKDKISEQNKTVKNILFFSIIIFLLLTLYFIVFNWLKLSSDILKQENQAEIQLQELKDALTEASWNVSNPGIFNQNIEKAESIIKELEEKQLFANELTEAKNEIVLYKKQFNKIEIFDEKSSTVIYELEASNIEVVKVLTTSWKTYIITKKWVVWPIISGSKPKTYVFNSLNENEYFVDAWILWTDIFISTNTSKIVRFSRTNTFNFANVSQQQSWENMKQIETYNSSVYTLGENNQIMKHNYSSTAFGKWVSYLKEEDLKNLWEIIWMWIDWGFYLVKKDLSVVKFFSSPYRLESLTVSNLPKNYELEEWSRFEIKAGPNLNYVYMLLNNKIFIFNTNTKDIKSTRNLTYIWQIEWANNKIIDFFVEKDWEIIILNNKWIYKTTFEEADWKLILK